MKKLLMPLILLMFCTALFSQDRYSLTLLGIYDYNTITGHNGGFDLTGHMPVNRHFEADAAFEFLSPQTFSGTLVARPKFPLEVGELFLEGGLNFRAFNKYGTANFTMAASFGYRMDYVSVQLGFESLELLDLTEKAGGDTRSISEPFNLIYRIAANVRPQSSVWNISVGITSFTLYEYERPYSPTIFLDAHYDMTNHLSIRAEADFKPSGIFNMTTHFNDFIFRTGLTYLF